MIRIVSEELAEKYGLHPETVGEAVATAVEETLSAAFGRQIFAVMDDATIEIYLARGCSSLQVTRIPGTAVSRKLRRRLIYNIERELHRRKMLAELKRHRGLVSRVISGIVREIATEGTLRVEFPAFHSDGRELHAVCPPRNQPPHERSGYHPGQELHFHVCAVRTVEERGVPQVEVEIGRTSRALTEGLLREWTEEENRICCHRRIPGAFSLVRAQKRIRKEAVRRVAAELGERVVVRYEER